MLSTVLLLVGFVLLIKGGDYLVNGASSIAKKYKISNIVIGLTVVSFGTSAPELIVNILASINGSADLAISNILGSNLSNILLILGITAIIYPLKVKKGTTWKEIPFSLLSVIALGLMVNDVMFDNGATTILSRSEALVLILFFIIFIYYTFGISKAEGGKGEKVEMYSMGKSIGMVLIGMAGLALGGHWVVQGAIEIAKLLNVSEALIGLTIVAIGTSLPELVTSVIAAKKKQADIAIGNVVGSNIFNVLWILGISGTIQAIEFSPALNFDIALVILATLLLFVYMFWGKNHTLQRWQGYSFVSIYVVYMIFLIMRG